MANSSEWISEIADHAGEAPAWIAALAEPAKFSQGAPFLATPVAPAPKERPSEEALTETERAVSLARAEGEAAGRAAAEAELKASDAHRHTLRSSFLALEQAAMDALASELVETVIELCGEVLGESAIDDKRLADRASLAAKKLGTAPEQMKLRLHPDDMAAFGEEVLTGCMKIPDAELSRGALRLEGPDGEVHDGPEQWRRAIAEALRG